MTHPHHDPTFYPSPHDAAVAPREKLAYVAAFSRPADKPDALAVVDVDPDSASYASVVGFTELTNLGDELHHFGWNACSSALCPGGGHDHGERRYLIVPGIRDQPSTVSERARRGPVNLRLTHAFRPLANNQPRLGGRNLARDPYPCEVARAISRELNTLTDHGLSAAKQRPRMGGI